MKKGMVLFCFFMGFCYMAMCEGLHEFLILGSPFKANVVCNNVELQKGDTKLQDGFKLKFNVAEWPNVLFKSQSEIWDWSEYCWLVVKVYNPGKDVVRVNVRIDNEGADGWKHCITGSYNLSPKQENSISFLLPNSSYPITIPGDKERLEVYSKHPLWGMRRAPGNFVEAKGEEFDLSKIVGFQIFLSKPALPTNLIIRQIKLEKQHDLPDFPLPFVDRLGQYKHADWKGKTHSEAEMVERAKKEIQKIKKHPSLDKNFDIYGGWKKGPQLKATGWFRTELIDGYWWLVTPEGHLFLSIGVDCIGQSELTFITKRENWFEYIPDANDPKFKSCFGYAGKGGHWFGHILEEGSLFSFYKANIIRQFGETWEQPWSEQTTARLKKWGFNTIGSWSSVHLFTDKKIPFIIILGPGNVPRIKNAPGYWGPMYDVFDPKYKEIVENSISKGVEAYKDNPYCIGYFVDNELSWDGIWEGTIKNDIDQPCKKEFVEQCKAKYGSIENLNKNWETSFSNWSEINKPEKETDAFKKDKNEYLTKFADTYFSVIAQAIKKYAPNQLYMGCRFAGFPPSFVWRSAQKYADVVSINIYRKEVPREHDLFKLAEKPIIIGEFHFGALDRGMFHTGLVACKDQKDRANKYENYIRSVATNPLFVGCHWFQWADQPITGRYFDGENYNIGLVDVTNKPYAELTKSAEKINKEAYQIRLKESGKKLK
ncbi:MAG TPA: beta-galactosidase [Candidatus Hydrogenedens sp.]|nr:beta-galactosidase [Candidatus Hydrogenedens sp.]